MESIMKRIIFISILITTLLSSQLQAHLAELIVRVQPYNSATRTIVMELYKVTESAYSHNLGEFITSGQQTVQGSITEIYIDMINSGSESYENGIFPHYSLGRQGNLTGGLPDLSGIAYYYIVIYSTNGNTKHYLDIDINLNGGGDVYFDYIENSTGNWTLSKYDVDSDREVNIFNEGSYSCTPTSLTVKNSFGAGSFYYDGIECTNTTSTGITYYLMNNTTTLNIQAQSPQTYPSTNGTTYSFKNWNDNSNYSQTSKDVTVNGVLTYEAKFYYYSALGLYTSFEGTNCNGYFLVNNTTTNTYTSISKRNDAQLTFTSQNQENSSTSLYYTFDCWKKDGTVISTSSTYQFYPEAGANYTLNLKPLKPTNTYRNQAFRNPDNSSPTPGSYIRINWSTHPDNRVNGYKIWRRVKHNGVVGDPVLLSTVGSSTTYYIDYDYVFTDGYTDDIVYYDVKAQLYYNGNYTYPDDLYEAAFGEIALIIIQNDKKSLKVVKEIPEDYSVNNYPNPFNPTTTISYQLPQDGFVTLKVYDIVGKEVASLVNENKNVGYYNVTFDASKLTSGIYIYMIRANNYVQSKKMLLVK
jgi:hypothetical protein